MGKCQHFWVVTAWFRARDEATGSQGLRASKLICAECGVERQLNIMGGLATLATGKPVDVALKDRGKS